MFCRTIASVEHITTLLRQSLRPTEQAYGHHIQF